jgi:hypothetical protein
MVTVFFDVEEIALLDVLPTVAKLTSDYSCCNIIEPLEQAICPEGRVQGITRRTLHFDNEPVCNAEKGQLRLGESHFRRLEHPPYSRDLAPCDFFLFGYLHDKMQFLSYGTVDELRYTIVSTIQAIPNTTLIQVFQTWRWRLEGCLQEEGNDFE